MRLDSQAMDPFAAMRVEFGDMTVSFTRNAQTDEVQDNVVRPGNGPSASLQTCPRVKHVFPEVPLHPCMVRFPSVFSAVYCFAPAALYSSCSALPLLLVFWL